ncbi:hypothetical protein NEUTE1DRAFT_83267 [Neurospora tetrasperma FGSC 2508]|uniref:Uncharacterized protein n=1 Tax=Neurospora tetrasperma (strain FGSC 2508 / ATCC MYA-4615 / P0657) TaxID=510951 RepID=F8MNZ4_NEUT8|nr:uncharacterized protein NEUTE1DRAFT_83267 [Neurospora tetrasperma FGSC 2508]EGO56213.1 hypothetical protein NEUTE1DRAFT_83267 [Neurospora tetrasperma FGSC 2508]EGZ70931.1 hypothetical protein NEUTE2DRAFT_151518 [Neurospora tetrasperma FGSC 2509]
MATSRERPRRKFTPIPVETTFERYRKAMPNGELTPSPSPRSPSPPPREKRRFAPQLVESSVRRSRRVGDEGPATKPTDKTDITPYTNHIYAPKAKAKRRLGQGTSIASPTPPAQRKKGHSRRESCDDEIADGFFDLVARDAQAQKMQEMAMSAFPNSSERIGGAEHFYVREGSEDDEMATRGRPLTRGPWATYLSRRNSSEEDISWAFKEMQEHAEMLQNEAKRDFEPERVSTLELDNMSFDEPLNDVMNLTSAPRSPLTGSPLWASRPSPANRGPIGESHMPLMRSESPLPVIGESAMPYIPPESPPRRPIGESFMPYIPSAPLGKAADMPYASPAQIPPDTAFGSHGYAFQPYAEPERDMSLERARNQHRQRVKASPPMLGQDLVFRMCQSPKHTKLEPDHLWDLEKETTKEDENRDPSEQRGLWRGYCFAHDKDEHIIPAERPQYLSTPYPSHSPRDPFAQAFGQSTPPELSAEGTPSDGFTRNTSLQIPPWSHPEHRTKNNERKGLHMLPLQGLEERLKKEKAAADLEEKIAAEFDDHFVTQVYNYLSLGYPALARQYDEELGKISRIPVEELGRDDYAIMENLWGGDDRRTNGDARVTPGGTAKATGHIMLDSEEKDDTPEENRCPRWKALKKYIYEWARQHPDLDAISPLAWGVRERRGSWGL